MMNTLGISASNIFYYRFCITSNDDDMMRYAIAEIVNGSLSYVLDGVSKKLRISSVLEESLQN
jgi:hypothetical protein